MNYSAIDFSRLTLPASFHDIAPETIYERLLTRFKELMPEYTAEVAADPVYLELEAAAVEIADQIALRNDQLRAVLFPHSQETDLDNLASFWGLTRHVIDMGDPDASPPIPPAYEKDTAFRERIALAPGSYTNAGTSFMFVSLVRNEFSWVADVAVDRPAPGLVNVYVMGVDDLAPSADQVGEVTEFLNGENRQLCAGISAKPAAVVPFEISANLTLFPNADEAQADQKARTALDQYLNKSRRMGYDVTIAGITAALFVPGYVQNVNVISPIADVVCTSTEVANCTASAITIVGHDV